MTRECVFMAELLPRKIREVIYCACPKDILGCLEARIPIRR